MQYVNCTEEVLKIICFEGTIWTLYPSGVCPKIKTTQILYRTDEDWGVEIFKSTDAVVECLPEPQDGVIYIVSTLILSKSQRTDLVAPGNLIKDINGKEIGYKGFVL